MKKRAVSLFVLICMIFSLSVSPAGIIAYAGSDDAMVQIRSALSEYEQGNTITLSNDGYIGIPVDITVYYDFGTHGKSIAGYNETPVILYVVNTNTKRIGTKSDESIIESMLERGYIVAVADYKNNASAVSPALEYSVQKIRTKLSSGEFFSDSNVFGSGTYVENHAVPAGYNITLSDVFFEFDKHGLNGELEKMVEVWNYDFRSFWSDKSVKWVYEDGTRKSVQNGFDGSAPVWYADAACTTVDNQNGQYIKVGHTWAKSIFDLVKPDGTPVDLNLYIHIIYPEAPEYDVPVMTLASSSEHLASSYSMEERPHLLGYAFNGYAVAMFDHGYIPMARGDHYGHFNAVVSSFSNAFRSDSREIYQQAAMRYLRYISINNHETYSFDINKMGVFGNSKGGFQTYLGDPMFVKEQYSADAMNVGKEEIEKLVEKKLLNFGAKKGLVALDPEDPVTDPEGEGTKLVFASGTRYTNGHTQSETKHGITIDGGTMQPWLTYTENGVTKEIPSGVQMVYSSCGCMPEYMREGFSPVFSAAHVFDSFGGAFNEHNYVANKMRTENIPSLYFEMPLEHEFVHGKDMVYGVDAYDALFAFSDYYLKDAPVGVVYTDPKNGDGVVTTTDDITIKFYGPVPDDEIKKVEIKDENGDIISGVWQNAYGNTEWSFIPASPLKGNSSYSVTVPAGIKGDNGKELGKEYTYSFGTGNEEYVATESSEALVTDKDGMNVEFEVPDLSNADSNSLKLRFRVTNDAANIAQIYVVDATSSGKSLVGTVNLKGAGYYEYDITDYVKNNSEKDVLKFHIKAQKASGDNVVYTHEFENLKQIGTNRESSPVCVTEVEGEAVTALKQTSGLHTWSKYGYTYFTPVRVTNSYFINDGNPVTAQDYGRKFTVTYRYKDMASRNLELYHNICSDPSTFTMDYDYEMKSQWTTPGVWEEISLDYTSYEKNYGVESVVKTLTLEIPPQCDGEAFYVDKLTVTEHISDINVDGVYLVSASQSDEQYEDKIPAEYKDKEEYPFVAFIGDKFVGAATHYCDKDVSDENSVLDIAYARLCGETKADTTLEVFLRRDYDVIAENGDVWFGNYGQIGGHLLLNLGGHHLNAQIGLFNPTVKHGWDSTLKISSLYDSRTTVKNGTISSKESVITHSIQPAGVDQYENIRNTYFTFENVKFVPGSNCHVNPILSSAGDVASVNHANLSLTLNNCEIDLSNVTKAVTLFNMDDNADRLRCDVVMNGGKITSDNLDGITLAKVNSTGTDSLTMGKNNGEYPELILSSGAPFGDTITTTTGENLQFIKHSQNGSQTVYQLGVKPMYGEIPAEYADVQEYPFAAFINGEFVAAGKRYADHDTSAVDSALEIARQYLSGESKKDTTMRILLRRDYDITKENGNVYYANYSHIGGTLIIDLGGHHMNAQMGMFNLSVKHGWDSTLKINSLYDSTTNVINGKITVKENFINHSITPSATDQYENIRNSYFNFENIDFELAENCSPNPFVASNTAATSVKHANLYVTFDNCNFDLTKNNKTITLFNVNDSANKYYGHIRINGGKITVGNMNYVTITQLNPEGTDSFVFGKYEDEYTELAVASGNIPTGAFENAEGEEVYFTKYSSDTNGTVYRLSEKTEYGVIPAEYHDAEKYPFVAFIDGKFIAAATHYSDKDVNVVDSVIDIAYRNIVGETKADTVLNILLRRDYEITTENGDAYSGIQGLIGGHMVLDLDDYHLNAQMGLFNLGVRHGWDPTLKINSLYDAYATVKNGSITVRDSNLGHTTVANGIDQYEKIRNTYVTYENIKFKTAATCSRVPFVQSNGEASSVNPANLYVTYTNCEFDLTATGNSMTLFNVNDSKDKYYGHITVNGGKIIAKNLKSVKLADLNSSGNDSFTLGKYDGSYPELIFETGDIMTDGFATSDNGVSYFGKYSSDGKTSVYHLGAKTDAGVSPYDSSAVMTVAEDGKSASATVYGGYAADYDNYVVVAAIYDAPGKLSDVKIAHVSNNKIDLDISDVEPGKTVKYMLLNGTSMLKPFAATAEYTIK